VARVFHRIVTAINLGMADNGEPQSVKKALELKQDQLESMSRIGRNLIDGKGIHRVLKELQALLD
jgi:hypothetical protein